MIRERVLRALFLLGIGFMFITTIQFVYFIDQFPLSGSWVLTIKHIDFLNGSYIDNASLIWMYFLIGFYVVVCGLSFFFFKPDNKKLLELSVYNILVSGMMLVALILYVRMFPERISSPVTHGFLNSSFTVDGESFKAVNLIYVIAFGHFILNSVFLSLKASCAS